MLGPFSRYRVWQAERLYKKYERLVEAGKQDVAEAWLREARRYAEIISTRLDKKKLKNLSESDRNVRIRMGYIINRVDNLEAKTQKK